MTIQARSLILVRATHSAIFLVELGAILWLVVSGLLGRRDRTVAVAGALVAAEAVVFVANSGVCPLTPLAERLGAGRGSVSDIFLPRRVAETIPQWSSALVAIAIVLHLRGLRDGRRHAAIRRPSGRPGRRARAGGRSRCRAGRASRRCC